MGYKILLVVFGAALLLLANEADCKEEGGGGSRLKRGGGGDGESWKGGGGGPGRGVGGEPGVGGRVKREAGGVKAINTTENVTPITSSAGSSLTPDEILAYDFARRQAEYRARITARIHEEAEKNNSSSTPEKYDSEAVSK